MCRERTGHPADPEHERPLPAARAFVLQLHGGADVARGHWVGRISHVVSGRTTHFQTLNELATFIESVLAGGDAQQPDAPEER